MNMSRAHTLAWHRRFSVGRVRPSTPDMVVRRDPAIESHAPVPSRRADMAPLGSWTLQGDRFGDGSHARTVSEDAKNPAIVVDHIERRRERTEPSAPFDLTGLEGHEFTSRTGRGTDAGGVAAPVWDEGRRVSAHRFGIRHP